MQTLPTALTFSILCRIFAVKKCPVHDGLTKVEGESGIVEELNVWRFQLVALHVDGGLVLGMEWVPRACGLHVDVPFDEHFDRLLEPVRCQRARAANEDRACLLPSKSSAHSFRMAYDGAGLDAADVRRKVLRLVQVWVDA